MMIHCKIIYFINRTINIVDCIELNSFMSLTNNRVGTILLELLSLLSDPAQTLQNLHRKE